MDFHTLITTFKKSAFRLEGLPHYFVPEEEDAMTHFLSTGEIIPELNKQWIEDIKAASARGAVFKRLRLISDPLSSYEQFEVQAYKANVEAGEEIRAMDREDWPWTGDFWYFDDTYIARMHYDNDGHFVGVDISEADEDDRADFEYWMDIYNSAPLLKEIY